uniref:Uncharacterized protein n=1 Tax=Daucus carota subsp. sativus TaxID=79200 RepID=A0A164U1X9_DAUCS
MVRTRSGIEVRVTRPNDVEDEVSKGGGANDVVNVESESCGEESNGEDENRATGDETT